MRIDVARNITFKAANKQTPKKTTNTDENPITVRGERSKLVAGTFIAGLGFGFKELLDLFDGDLICDTFVENGCNVAQKNFKNASNAKRAFLMGNALVCGIVTKIGVELERRLK